jgi:lipopolysaccharide/colanic/teichoic acid biosynthesis glycosyltransferase
VSGFAKRSLDIVGAILGLLVLSPLLWLIAGFVRIRLGRPIFFSQMRPGLDARPFTMYKFRTMRNPAEAHEGLAHDDQRMTPAGSLLRGWSLDELPQLWNVLQGHMSLVGPRPLLMEYLPHYSARQRRRHEVKPGLTGWSQVRGRNELSWPERLELDVWYVENQSFGLDLSILLQTTLVVVQRRGVTQPGRVTMDPFNG